MSLKNIQPNKTSQSIQRVVDAIARLTTQVNSSMMDFSLHHVERFEDAGVEGGNILAVSLFAKDALNTITTADSLPPEDSVKFHNAMQDVATGTPFTDATDGFSPKLTLLVQSGLIAYQLGQLDETPYQIPAPFDAVVNADNSVTTSDKPQPESVDEEVE